MTEGRLVDGFKRLEELLETPVLLAFMDLFVYLSLDVYYYGDWGLLRNTIGVAWKLGCSLSLVFLCRLRLTSISLKGLSVSLVLTLVRVKFVPKLFVQNGLYFPEFGLKLLVLG